MTTIRRKRRQGNDAKWKPIALAISTAGFLSILLYIVRLIPWRSSGGVGVGVGSRSVSNSGSGRLGQYQQVATTKIRQQQHPRKNTKYAVDNLLPMRRALEDDNFDPLATELARNILGASLNLVDIHIISHSFSITEDSYSGIVAEFCPLNFTAQKENPPSLPMFKDVVGVSPQCNKHNNVRVDLKEAVDLVREFDADNTDVLPTILDLKGVVFHESRCGSTLAANSMMALHPEKNRVYSESSPPPYAFKICGEDYSDCSPQASANLLKDIIYLMGRSNDPKEQNLFFKFQSVTTRNLESFRLAFPTTPWVFMYRNPIEVMMSQLDVPHTSKANCVRSKHSSPLIKKAIAGTQYKFDDLSDEEFCAVHLATICESALRNLEDADGVGMAIKYTDDLEYAFIDTVFPKHFHALVDEDGRQRVEKIAGTYSKGRGMHEGEFHSDSEEKIRNAPKSMKDAADEFLGPVNKLLDKSSYNFRPEEEE
ncbi:hypothetical protein ACHAWU_010096 [Discostella pseudostelligera]|uniref:Sulfotransferase n=1 Tax=Discostella pseudostelligera TaxID=259834 RepID=A0ABD3MD86_9STRA